MIGIIMASMSTVGAIASSQIRRLSSVYTEKQLIEAASVLLVLTLAAIPFVPNIWLLLILTLVFGFAQGIIWPAILALFTGAASADNRGALMAVYGIVSRLGTLVGPILMGAIFKLWSIGSVFFLSAGLSAVMLLLVIIAIK